jgi:hypothetical protein
MSQDQVLREACLNALSNYVRQAQRTCELLSNAQDQSLSLEQLLAILAHTQIENDIQKSYIELRQRLFHVLIRNGHNSGSSQAVSKSGS